MLNSDGVGEWATEGCWLDTEASGAGRSVCKCNHLTSFAILMVSKRRAVLRERGHIIVL